MVKSNIEYYGHLLRNPLPSYKRWFNEEKKYMRKVISGGLILSVACGEGREIDYIKDKAQKIVGIDHSPIAVEHAKRKFLEGDNVRIILADAIEIPFQNGYFDYVICLGSFTNFDRNKIPALKEMKRVLKKSGKIVLSAYSEDALSERMKLYKRDGIKIVKVEGGKVYFERLVGDNVSEQFSRVELESFFKEVGLKVEEIKKVGIGYICLLSK